MPVAGEKRSIKVDSTLEAPRFDSMAAANAQPVEPIPRGFSSWIEKSKSVRELITTRARALSLIIIAGLATGTLGGILMVNDPPSSIAPVTSLADSERTKNLIGADSGAYGFLINRNTGRNRKARHQARSAGAPRAYRVAVIRY